MRPSPGARVLRAVACETARPLEAPSPPPHGSGAFGARFLRAFSGASEGHPHPPHPRPHTHLPARTCAPPVSRAPPAVRRTHASIRTSVHAPARPSDHPPTRCRHINPPNYPSTDPLRTRSLRLPGTAAFCRLPSGPGSLGSAKNGLRAGAGGAGGRSSPLKAGRGGPGKGALVRDQCKEAGLQTLMMPHPQRCIRMAVRRRGRGGPPPPGPPPPPPDQSDKRGIQRNLQSGKSCRAIFGTQTFGSQTPPPPPPLLILPCSPPPL